MWRHLLERADQSGPHLRCRSRQRCRRSLDRDRQRRDERCHLTRDLTDRRRGGRAVITRTLALPVLAIASIVVVQACGSEQSTSPMPTATPTHATDASIDTSPQAPPITFPSPSTDACTASCARLEALGPVVELSPPFEES